MEQLVAVRTPFVLAQSLAFMRRFTPCQGDHLLDDDRVTTAVALGARAVAVRIAEGPGATVALTHPDVDADDAARIAHRARQLLSLDDELDGFYRAAAGDAAPFAAIVDALHGLHQVRFSSLPDIAVYAVLMQRRPITQAGRMRQQVLAALGLPVEVDGHTLRAWPSFGALVGLDVAAWQAAGVDAHKAAQLPPVVRGVAALGEPFLATAPYAEARAALCAIPGIGPFSAAAILLRGLGRMDDVPLAMKGFAEPARDVYGAAWDPRATVRARAPHRRRSRPPPRRQPSFSSHVRGAAVGHPALASARSHGASTRTAAFQPSNHSALEYGSTQPRAITAPRAAP
jgi:DNA-3-methyladenine glycosylase II